MQKRPPEGAVGRCPAALKRLDSGRREGRDGLSLVLDRYPIGFGRPFWNGTSTIRHVHRQAAQTGFLVLLVHVAAGLAHGFDADVEAYKVLAVAAH